MRLALVRSLALVLGGLLFWLLSQPSSAAPIVAQELRVQTVVHRHYFHFRVDIPADMVPENERFERGWWNGPLPLLAPRLVSPDGELLVVCQRFERDGRLRDRNFELQFGNNGPPIRKSSGVDRPAAKDKAEKDVPRQPVAVRGLEFIGRYDGKVGTVKAKLLYPVPGKTLPIAG
jgi:hypothetical protein